jgi:surface protein
LKDEISCEHKYGHISNWDVSQVTNMCCMFDRATNFNQPLNNWKVSKVTDMHWIFCGATNFNQHLNNLVVSQVTNMCDMFKNSKLEQIYNIILQI